MKNREGVGAAALMAASQDTYTDSSPCKTQRWTVNHRNINDLRIETPSHGTNARPLHPQRGIQRLTPWRPEEQRKPLARF
jgi:hypothetical protein